MSWLNRGLRTDDALIYERYIQNAFRGLGLVYNAGEHINALSSFLYVDLGLLVRLVVPQTHAAAVLLSGLSLAAACVTGAILFGRTPLERGFCALGVATSAYFYLCFGMETGLYIALIAATVLLYDRKHYGWTGIVFGLLVLTRLEGALLGLVLTAHFIWVTRRLPPWRYAVAPVLIVAVHLGLDTLYYGSPLPLSVTAKLGQGHSPFSGGGWHFAQVGPLVQRVTGDAPLRCPFIAVTATLGSLVAMWRSGVRLCVAYLLVLATACLAENVVSSYFWYYAPFFFTLFLLAGLGTARILAVTLAAAPGNRAVAAVAALCLLLTGAYGVSSLSLAPPLPEQKAYLPYRLAGEWVGRHTEPGASVGAMEIGYLGFFSDRRIVDIMGLATPYNADYIAHGDIYSWLGKYQPDYIVVHAPMVGMENGALCVLDAGAYSKVQDFAVPYFALLRKVDDPRTPARIAACAAKVIDWSALAPIRR